MSSVAEDHKNYQQKLIALLRVPRIDNAAIIKFYSEHVRFPNPREKDRTREYIEERFKIAEELILLAEVPTVSSPHYLEALFHLANARAAFNTNCHYQPLKEYSPLCLRIKGLMQHRWMNQLLGFAENERAEQLTALGQIDDDYNYNDDAYLRTDSNEGIADVSVTVACLLTSRFPPCYMVDKIQEFYREQIQLFKSIKRKLTTEQSGKEEAKKLTKEAATHLMNSMICYANKPVTKWPKPLRAEFDDFWLQERGYSKYRFYRIALARRQYLDDYDCLMKATADQWIDPEHDSDDSDAGVPE